MTIDQTTQTLTRRLIKYFESYRATSYFDVTNHPTIGYGHLITPSEFELYHNITLTEDQAEELLQKDIEERANIADVVPDLDQYSMGQIAALTSLCFNIGIVNFKMSTLLKHLKAKQDITDDFAQWRRSGGKIYQGLEKRRLVEQMIYRDDVLDPRGDLPSVQWEKDLPTTDENWKNLKPIIRLEACVFASTLIR